jgi:single-stranded-DNA-specific exonuclease
MAVLERPAWIVAPPDPEAAGFARALDVHPIVAAVLRRRGFATEDEARRFLHPELGGLSDPLLIPGMAEAVDTLARALRDGRRIAVHGDYDVDGITSTAILVRGLRSLGADPLWYLPHRTRDGYGLGVAAVERLAAQGAQCLVAVDCGITALDAVARARDLGLTDVVVIDHHTPGSERPAAVIVAPGEDADAAPCAAGLTFLCAWVLGRRLRGSPEPPLDLVALAALGTVADVVPLLGDNRRVVAVGLGRMREAPLPGVRALMDEAGVEGPIDAWHIGWLLGPRLNAPGRLGDPVPALRLLLTDDAGEARDLARQLGDANRERQAMLEQALTEAIAQVASNPSAAAFVVVGRAWHAGIVGLVAGRLAEQYGRPAVAISLTGDTGRGSARSVPGFHLVDALGACRAHLLGFGGHATAAGLSIAASEVDAFRRAFCEVAERTLAGVGPARLEVDAEVGLADLTPSFVDAIERLAPFGAGNPRPVLAARGVRVLARRLVGDGSHVRLGVTDGAAYVEAIGFGMADWGELLAFTDAPADLAFAVERDRLDPTRVRMRLCAIDVPGVDPDAILTDTGLLVDRLFRRAADYLGTSRYAGIDDSDGLYTKVVGVTFDARQRVIAGVREGDPLRLRREPANAHDPHAILVTTDDGRDLGYLNARLAGRLAPAIDMGDRYRATVTRVTGGGDRTLGVNIYVERAEDEPRELIAAARRHAWARLDARQAIDRLPAIVTDGRPLRPALAQALSAVAEGRRTVLSMPPGRGTAAAIAGAAAIAASRGTRALVVAPLARTVEHRAEQLAARLAPLGLRIVTLHGLASVRDRERAVSALRSGNVDVLVVSVEALRGDHLPVPAEDLAGLLVLDGLSAGEARWLPPAYAAVPALFVSVWPEATALARDAGVPLLRDARSGRSLARIMDRRDAADCDAVMEEVLSSGEKTVVYTAGGEECVRLAARLRTRVELRGRRLAYLHGGLPRRLRQIVTRAFRDGRLDVLVTTPALDEEAAPPDVRCVVVARLPWNRAQLLAACAVAGLDHRPATIVMACGAEERDAAWRMDALPPDRDVLARIYRALRERFGASAFLWPDDATWAWLSAAVPGISRASVDAACAILDEVGLATRESAATRAPGGDGLAPARTESDHAAWLVQLVASGGRKDLTGSLRYREGLRERRAWETLAAWVRAADPQEILRAALGS